VTKTTLVYFSLILLVSGVITACDQKPNPDTPVPKVSGISTGSASGADKAHSLKYRGPLNLNINDAVPEREKSASDFFQEASATTSANISRFQAAPSERRVRIDGKLYTNTDKENYFHIVDGGKVSLELKFK